MRNIFILKSHRVNKWTIWAAFALSGCLISVLIILVNPSARTGPFGIGLPAKMEKFYIEQIPLAIDYPESWVPFETPGGNHGDLEVVATISVPGRSYPQVFFMVKQFPDGTLEQVAKWGEQRVYTKIFKAQGYDFVQMDFGETYTSDGDKYLYRDYLWKQKSIIKEYTIHCLDNYFIIDDQGIIIRTCSEDEDWSVVQPVFNDMMQSLKFGAGS